MRDSMWRWKVASAASNVRDIWEGERVCVYPFGGGVGGDISVIGEEEMPDLARRKLSKLERALYSGRAMISFSFCRRKVSRRLAGSTEDRKRG